ncbi:hypothetical protein ACQ4PT_047400 [Festuca glaucescens]
MELATVALAFLLAALAAAADTTPVNKSCVTGSAGASVSIGYGGASAGVGVSLGADAYQSDCPIAEEIIHAAVEEVVAADPRMAASLLRLHFHDCFVNGCDGSVLLDDTPFFVGEKTAVPNASSLRGFEVVDAIKAELEQACPETVSCADVLAIAARDSVVASGGPSWQVEVGRKDSCTASLQAANSNLPAPTSGVATLVQKFTNVGLSAKDMVALSGAHTIGKARCTTFSARIAGVGVSAGSAKDMGFLQSLQQLCAGSAGSSALAHLDLSTPATFDNQYYINLLSGVGLLPSDQALASPAGAEDVAALVADYAFDASLFFDDFAASMLRMEAGAGRRPRRQRGVAAASVLPSPLSVIGVDASVLPSPLSAESVSDAMLAARLFLTSYATPSAVWPNRSYYGPPYHVCGYCGASFWFRERCKRLSTVRKVVYYGCCRGGKVSLPIPRPWPSPLRELLRFDGDARSNHFMRSIREYNAMFAFTSLGVHVDKSINSGGGPYVFKICGVVHHRIGSLLPRDGHRPEYAQLYIYDDNMASELDHRMDLFRREVAAGEDLDARAARSGRTQRVRDEPDRSIVASLMEMLNSCNNPLVHRFRMARERLFDPHMPEVKIRLFGHEGTGHDRRYSLPTASELAALIVGELPVDACRFDVVVQRQSGLLENVSPLNPSLMALQYPLLFPYGDMGYHIGIKYVQDEVVPSGGRDEVSMLEYYCYHFHYRKGETNPFTCCGRSSQQIEVDSYSCVESNRLTYHLLNQDTLRLETYQGISDALGEGTSTGKNLGVQYLLHSSFTGGRRYMVLNYQDGMAVCRQFGPPDLLCTFTCNPKWQEIADALYMEPGQIPSDRPDIITRVFAMKLNEFADDVKAGHAFGRVNAYFHVVEFQKRGLPHAHILVWLKADTRDATSVLIDSYVTAEIPDYRKDPLGYALVEEFMIHGPCGESNPTCPCMKAGACSKRFPKSFNDDTFVDGLGFPVYRRRKDDRYVLKNGVRLDNRSVVPYNMALLKKFQGHLNVEWCNKTNLLKYLFKYLAKGHDKSRAGFQPMHASVNPAPAGANLTSVGLDSVAVGVNPTSSSASSAPGGGVNEITEYTNCRYLSACEACWRMFAFDIHGRAPSVERLVVHMPNMNRVIYHEDVALQDLVDDPLRYNTMLTEWFTANRLYSDARQLTYLEFPSAWTWVSVRKVWAKRKRKLKFGPKVGRIYHVHPSTGELFFLRMLLTVVRGAFSFEDVRTYGGRVYDTFKEACRARGLVGDDSEWFFLFDEAIVWATSFQLRNLFMTVLLFCGVTDARRLFDRYWRYMADDILIRIEASLGNSGGAIPSDYLHTQLLQELNLMFAKNGSMLSSFNLTVGPIPAGQILGNRLILEELQYDRNILAAESISLKSRLNGEQTLIYTEIMDAVNAPVGSAYFVSGHGGTGKTFLWNAIVTAVRADGKIVLAVASSGVASLLLPGGRTGHSRFRIPVQIDERSLCNISRGTNLAGLVQQASLILWDEAPMTNRRCFEALDRSLRDILSVEDNTRAAMLFGGKTVVFGGDFRQVLPVVEGGSKVEIINASLVKSPLWQGIKVLRLCRNMRLLDTNLSVSQRNDLTLFAQWVLDVGNGDVPFVARQGELIPSWMPIPHDLLLLPSSDNMAAMIDSVYDTFQQNYDVPEYLACRAIVSPTNTAVEDLNNAVLARVPG